MQRFFLFLQFSKYKMKYTRLTKEQLEELHPEFVNFLASQSIDKKEWEFIKTNKPDIALQEIDVFSDLIWEKALLNVRFVDHFSKNYIFLFKCSDKILDSIIVKTTNDNVDFTTTDGIEWLSKNFESNEVEFQEGSKKVDKNRNEEVFELIRKGGMISKGDLYTKLITLLSV